MYADEPLGDDAGRPGLQRRVRDRRHRRPEAAEHGWARDQPVSEPYALSLLDGAAAMRVELGDLHALGADLGADAAA